MFKTGPSICGIVVPGWTTTLLTEDTDDVVAVSVFGTRGGRIWSTFSW